MVGRNVHEQLQGKFAAAMLVNGNKPMPAALQAGYSPRTAKSDSYLMPQMHGMPEKIKKTLEEFRAECKATFLYNANKLITVVEKFIPDDGMLLPKKAIAGVKAIAELNKMLGYYAPIKTENKNENTEVKRYTVEIKQLMEVYDKEY